MTGWKLAAATGLTVSAAASGASPAADILPFFNVTLTTLGMSAAGSMIAFAYGTPVRNRKKLYGYAVGGMFIGVWSVQLLPPLMHWPWYSQVLDPPMAGIVALLSRWIVPLVVEQIPDLWRRVFGVRGGRE